MATRIGEIEAVIRADTSRLDDDLRRAGSQISRFGADAERGFGRVGAAVVALNQAVQLGAAAGSLLVGALRASVGAAAEAERAVAQLAQTLRGAGRYSAEYLGELRGLAGELQRVTAYSDEAILEVVRLLTAFGAAPEQIRPLTLAALDLATAMGRDVSGAAIALGRALQGQTELLARWGLAVERTKGQHVSLADVLTLVERRFGGQAAAAAATFEGRVRLLGELLGDLREEFGAVVTGSGAFAQGLARVADGLSRAIDGVRAWREARRDAIDAAAAGAAEGLAGAIERLPAALDAAAVALDALGRVARGLPREFWGALAGGAFAGLPGAFTGAAAAAASREAVSDWIAERAAWAIVGRPTGLGVGARLARRAAEEPEVRARLAELREAQAQRTEELRRAGVDLTRPRLREPAPARPGQVLPIVEWPGGAPPPVREGVRLPIVFPAALAGRVGPPAPPPEPAPPAPPGAPAPAGGPGTGGEAAAARGRPAELVLAEAEATRAEAAVARAWRALEAAQEAGGTLAEQLRLAGALDAAEARRLAAARAVLETKRSTVAATAGERAVLDAEIELLEARGRGEHAARLARAAEAERRRAEAEAAVLSAEAVADAAERQLRLLHEQGAAYDELARAAAELDRAAERRARAELEVAALARAQARETEQALHAARVDEIVRRLADAPQYVEALGRAFDRAAPAAERLGDAIAQAIADVALGVGLGTGGWGGALARVGQAALARLAQPVAESSARELARVFVGAAPLAGALPAAGGLAAVAGAGLLGAGQPRAGGLLLGGLGLAGAVPRLGAWLGLPRAAAVLGLGGAAPSPAAAALAAANARVFGTPLALEQALAGGAGGAVSGTSVLSGVLGGVGLGATVAGNVAPLLGRPVSVGWRWQPNVVVSGLGGAAGGAGLGALVGSLVPGIGTAIGAALGGVLGGVLGGGTGGLFGRPNWERETARAIADLFGRVGIPTFPGRFRHGVLTRSAALEVAGLELAGLYGPAETAGLLAQRALRGVGEAGFVPRRTAHAFLAAMGAAGIPREDAGDRLRELARWLGPAGLAEGVGRLVELRARGDIGGEELRRHLGHTLELFTGLPEAVDRARLALAAFTEHGEVSLRRLTRAVESATAAVGGGLAAALEAVVRGGTAADAAQALGEQFGRAFVSRVQERLLAAEGLGAALTEAVALAEDLAAARAAGDRTRADRLAAALAAVYARARDEALTRVVPVAELVRQDLMRLRAGGGTAAPGVVWEARVPRFQAGGVVPGLPGTATLAVVHGGERVLSQPDNAALLSLLGEIAASLRRGRAVHVEVLPAPVILDGRVIAGAVDRARRRGVGLAGVAEGG